MKKMFILLVLSFSLLFAGCSNLGGSSNGGQTGAGEEVVKGEGLEVRFNIDDKYLDFTPDLDYSIEIENSGKHPITLDQSDISIETLQLNDDGSGIIEEQSFEALKDNLFSKNSQIRMPYGTKREAHGTLKIIEDFYKQTAVSDFTINLNIKYEYETDFNNNLEINVAKNEMDTDTISQAAPVQMTNIEYRPKDETSFRLIYTIEDVGDSRFDETIVEIDRIDVKLGNNNPNSCEVYVEEGNKKTKVDNNQIRLTKDLQKVLYVCDYNLEWDRDETINTVTSGSFTYNYELEFEETIRLPENRGDEFE